MRTPQDWLAITSETRAVGVKVLGGAGESVPVSDGVPLHDEETSIFLDADEKEGECRTYSDEGMIPDGEAYDEYVQSLGGLGEDLDGSDAAALPLEERIDDGNLTGAPCEVDLHSESDDGADPYSAIAAGKGQSCCGSSEQSIEDSDLSSLSEEDCLSESRDVVEELGGALDGECVGSVESSAVTGLEACATVEDVGDAAPLRVGGTDAVDLISDDIGGDDSCLVVSDDEVSSCCEIVCDGGVDMPPAIPAVQSATSSRSFEAIERLVAWLVENKRRPRRGQEMDGPLRSEVTEEDSVAHTWNDLDRLLISGSSALPGDVRSRFEHFKKLMREDSEWIAAEARRYKSQTLTQRSFECLSFWLHENKRKPMRGRAGDENRFAQTWNTLWLRLERGYNLPANVVDGIREFDKKMKEDPMWVASATARSSAGRRPRVAAPCSPGDVLQRIHCLLLKVLRDTTVVKNISVASALEALSGEHSKETVDSWTLLGKDVGNLEVFQVLLDMAKTHEIGTSAQLISHDVVQLHKGDFTEMKRAVGSVLTTVNWVTLSIQKIYDAVATEIRVTPDDHGADAVRLNQCLVEMAAVETEKGVKAFLFSSDVVASTSVCKACVTRQGRNGATPVFHPCLRKCNEKVSYCGTHVGKIDSGVGLLYGEWDPAGGHLSMPPVKRAEGLRLARFRWDAAMRRDDVAACLLGNAFVDLHGTRARHQRPYVFVDSESRGQLREWSRDAVPVAPFPCMLCDAGFATKLLWEQHVAAHHVSLQWYRQRL